MKIACRMSVWLVATFVLLASITISCGQRAPLPEVAELPPVNPQAPVLPKDSYIAPEIIAARRPSVQAQLRIGGDAAYQRGTGATPDPIAEHMTLQGQSGLQAWAMYCFTDLLDSDKTLGISVDLVAPLPTTCYVAYSNYSNGVWEWQSFTLPSTEETIAIPDGDDPISDGGNVYVLVASHNSATAVIGSVYLQLDMDAPPPQALAASDGSSASTISLSWIDPADSYAGLVYAAVVIERLVDSGGQWQELAQVTPGVTAYDDIHTGDGAGGNNIPYETPVLYRLRTLAGGHTGPAAPPDSGYRVLTGITDLSATDGTLHDRVAISWGSVPGADGYDLYYKQTRYGEAYWVVLAQLAAPQTSFDHLWDDPAKPCWYNNSYDYRVKARYLTDEYPLWSNVDAGYRVLPDVTGVSASDGAYSDRISIAWDSLPVADGYDLEATRTWHDGGVYSLIAHLDGAGSTSFDHTATEPAGLECRENTSYTYRVKASFNADRSLNYATDRGHYGPGAWPMYRRTLKHDAVSQYAGPHTQPQQQWIVSGTGGEWFASPIIGGDETIYVGTFTSTYSLYAVNPDGTILWKYSADNEIKGSPAVSNGIIYFGTLSGNVTALNKDGTFKWSYNGNGEINGSPSIGNNGKLYIGIGVNLYSINLDGSLDWWYPTGDLVESSAAIDDDGIIYFGSDDGYIYSVLADGTLNWAFATSGAVKSSPLVNEYGVIYIGSDDHYLYALSDNGTTTPTLEWKSECSDVISYSCPLIIADYVLIGAKWLNWIESDGINSGTTNGSACPVLDIDGVIFVGVPANGIYGCNSGKQELFNIGYPPNSNQVEIPITVAGALILSNGSYLHSRGS